MTFLILATFLPAIGQELVVGFTFDTVCLGKPTRLISTCYISDTAAIPRDSIVGIAWDSTGTGQFVNGPDTVHFYFTAGGIHNVGIKAFTRNGQVKAVYRLVRVNSLNSSFTASNSCIQEPVRFTNTSQILGDTTIFWTWKFGDGATLNGVKNPSHQYPDTGQYVVTLIGKFKKGSCPDTARQTIHVSGNPVLTLVYSMDTIIHSGDTLLVSVVGTYDHIEWNTGDTTNTIMITKAGKYSVKAYRGLCYGQKSFTVTIALPGSDPMIANLFTPNSDGYNDRWEFLNLGDFKPCQADVYDRFGIKVFSSSDYKNDWDGTYNGKILANDTYYYFVTCREVLYKGTVNILK